MLLASLLFVGHAAAQTSAYGGGARLVPQVGHNAAPSSATFSADGALLLTTSGDGAAIVWHTASGAILRRLEGHDDWVSAGAFSADRSRIATASNDDTVIVWDAASGRALHTLRGHAHNVRAVAFVAGGTRLASADDRGTVIVWDPATGAVVHTLAGERTGAGSRSSLTDTRATTPNRDGSVTTWDLATGKSLATVLDGEIATAVLSPDGARLLTAGRGADAKPALRDAATGKLVASLQVHPNGVRSAAFSPDGARVATVDGDGSAWVFQAKNGARIGSMPNAGVARIAVSFSPDGATVATANGDGSVSLWNAATGKEISTLRPPGEAWSSAESAVFSSDGSQLVVVSSNAAMWDTRMGKLQTVFRSRTAGVWDVAPSPNDAHLATGSFDGRVAVWSARTGALAHQLENQGGAVDGLGWSPGGERLVSASLDQTAMVWDAATGAFVSVLRGHAQAVRDVAYSADGASVVTAGTDGLAIVWDAATGQEVARFEGGGTWVVWAELSADNKRLTLGTLDGKVSTWDVKTRKRLSGFEVGNAIAYAPSPDGSWLFTGGEAGPPSVWDRKTGKRVRTLEGAHTGAVIAAAVSKDGGALVTVGDDGRIVVWSTAAWKAVRTLAGDARSAAISADGKWLWTGHPDATTRLWELSSGAERAALLSFADGTWAVVDPEGRFDASDDGDVDGLVWVIGGEPYALDQLREHFYDPGLLAKILGTRPEPLRTVPALAGVNPPPKVHVEGPDATGRVRMKLEDCGGGVGDVLVLLNGSDVSEAVRSRCGSTLTTGCTVELSTLPTWVRGGQNRFEAFASIRTGEVRSRGTVREVVASGKANQDPPDLWVIAVGTGDYAGDAIDLVYPPVDAARFAEAMEVAGARAFGPDRTHVRILSTATEVRPSAPALGELSAWLKGSDPGDTVVLYLSGHGVSLADGTVDDYFYLMPEAGSLDDLRDAQVREKSAWSGTQLAALLSSAPALKRAVILDTCAAGKFDGALAASRDLSSDAVRAHARAQERTGAWFLAGAAADKVSYEASRFSQGLLTYALLEGMRGPALAEGDLLLVSRWFRYAEDQVPVYARGIGGVQQPITRQADGGDFPLGALAEGDRGRVPLAMPKPVVVRAQVMTADGRPDRLGVGKAINQALRDAAAKPDATIVVWDSEPSDDTWQVTGQYREQAGALKFTGYLTRSGAQVEEVALALDAATPEALASSIVGQVVARVR